MLKGFIWRKSSFGCSLLGIVYYRNRVFINVRLCGPKDFSSTEFQIGKEKIKGRKEIKKSFFN
jgi:hypothetical protein